MKALNFFKNASLIFIFFLAISANVFAQTPQYYNSSADGTPNSFPFNIAGGKMIQAIIPPGTIINPAPAPAGSISKYYVRIASTGPLGPATYTSFYVAFAQSTITEFSGAFFAGPFDTVYKRASVTLSAAGGSWLEFALDHPFTYDPTKSLIVEIGQCGVTGTFSGYSIAQTVVVPNRRTYSTAGCPFTYGGAQQREVNCGITFGAPIPCTNFGHTWTTGLAAYPPGATNASRVIPSGITINDTGYVFIMGGGTGTTTNSKYNTVTNTWTTGAVLPSGLATTTGVRVKDSIYIIGGYNGTSATTQTYRYAPKTDTWTTKSVMPTATMNADMVILPWKDSLIICVGGDAGLFAAGQTNAVRVYNTYTDTWQNLAGTSLFPVQLAKMGGAIIGDTIFTFGGYNGATIASSYRGIISGTNPISITWTAIAPLPTTIAPSYAGALYRVAAATIKGMNSGVLLLGGANGTFYNGIAHLYNPCSGTYTALTSATGSNKNNLGATLPTFQDSIVYFIAGYNATGQTTNVKITARCYFCSVTGITGNEGNIPADYSLSQNYPNPFNPTTKISFALPKSGLVSLKVFDMLGREVAILVNENKTAGNYIVDFDASAFSSGVYFYRLEADGFIATKKMMLVK